MKILFSIAKNSWTQFVRDKIFYLALMIAILLVGFSYLLSTLTILENRKILLDFGFAAISLAGLFVAIFVGIVAVARELENKTIYTIVTKPVSRPVYLVGKFLGGALVLAATHLLLAVALIFIVRISGEVLPAGFWACCGLILLENLIVLSFAFLVSILFSSVMAGGFTFAFFLVGRSSLAFQVMANKAETGEIRFIARALYYVFPNLERFNLRDVVAYGQAYPESMVPTTLVYAVAYIVVCLGLASMVFQKRDLP